MSLKVRVKSPDNALYLGWIGVLVEDVSLPITKAKVDFGEGRQPVILDRDCLELVDEISSK